MTKFFVVLFVLLATHTIDAREPWPPKDGLGHDLPKELSAAYWFVSDADPRKFPYPDEVQALFYDFDVRIKFWFMVGRMMEIAKRGNGKVLPEDQTKLKDAVQRFFLSLRSNRSFARLSAFKQKKIALGMHGLGVTQLAAEIILLHSLKDVEQQKERNRK